MKELEDDQSTQAFIEVLGELLAEEFPGHEFEFRLNEDADIYRVLDGEEVIVCFPKIVIDGAAIGASLVPPEEVAIEIFNTVKAEIEGVE